MTTDKVSGPHARSLSIATQESDATGDEGPPERSSDGSRSSQTVLLVHDGMESLEDVGIADVPAAIRKASRQHGFVWVQLVNPDEDIVTEARRDPRDPSGRGGGCRLRPAAAESAEVRGAPLRAAVADHCRRGIERHRARPDIPLHRRRVAAHRSTHRRGRRRPARLSPSHPSNCATARSRRPT